MDGSIFEMLDNFENHARPHDNAYLTQNSRNSDTHGGYERFQSALNHHQYRLYQHELSHRERDSNTGRRHAYDYDNFDDDVTFDEFDQRLLRQHDDDRTRQAQEGRARLSLLPAASSQQYARTAEPHRGNCNGTEIGQPGLHYAHQAQDTQKPRPQRNPFMFQSSSSPRALPSSPSVRASQRGVLDRRSSYAKPHELLQHTPYDKENVVEAEPSNTFKPDFIREQSLRQPKQSGMPLIQGIELVSTHELPDRFRTVFPFPAFNAVQSRCFNTVYCTNDNFVVSAPTGSGKTVIFELAILRLVNSHTSSSFKAVYQAPTKALCCERQRDWEKKFQPLGLKVKELTGDTTNEQLHDVQTADLIITTPEKWDSMTRRWKDHERLVQMVKLFLIDEVHILKEDRGATLEAVVSRMKSVGTDVRFVALSATVPNFEDIAIWLGKCPTNQDISARKERFGEDFRPVKLQKHVIGFGGNTISDFGFDKILSDK
ncbi:putative ATP-dependent DNA helicase HFM1 [Lasiodiplodia hormozganensis]|uniref:ATP-dependent DNA helicase HFM1 n=1 Tax=Lasiodiplodia hormozganensis TaxID=869390 RepID=A0AA40CPF8_9PEZI|nr:putative ATP-dependent DNA helicase HFM1 [Lasiodiplodia hormozganensis]